MRLNAGSSARASARGFTLFEVAISLALVAFGLVSVLMLFPAGIKAQQLSRYQILASVRAMEMVDIFSSATDASLMLDREGPHPWDTATSYHAYAPDLETRIGTFRFGLFPLPPDIAKRLDSDGDEIQRILAEGAYVYYSQPSATSGFNPVGARANLPAPNEAQKIICAVTGYAQQNAIPSLSYKDWPYHVPYPSPPMHILNTDTSTSRPNAPWSVFYTDRSDKFMLFEDTLDADNGEMALVFQAIVKGPDLPLTTLWVNACGTTGVLNGKYNHMGKPFYRSSGYWAYGDYGGWVPEYTRGVSAGTEWRQNNSDGSKRNNASPYDVQPMMLPHFRNTSPFALLGTINNPIANNPTTGAPTKQKELARESALAYFALAKWYAARKGVSNRIADGVAIPDDASLLAPTNLFQSGSGNPALAVNAARLLAHAAMSVTQHFLPDGSTDELVSIGQLDVIREGSNAYAGQSPPYIINKAIARNYVENAMKLGMRFAASYPYDWGSPRPLNRATMMDFPLLQYDPFESGRITPITTYFSGYAYGTRPATATRPAKSPEQWKILSAQPISNIGRSISYPSMNLQALWPSVTGTDPNRFTLARRFEPADRTRQIVFWAVDWQSYEDFETAPSAPVDASRYPKRSPHGSNLSGNAAKPDILMQNAAFHDRHQFSARNPEKTLAFIAPTLNEPSGTELLIGGNDSMWADDKRPDLGISNSNHPNAPMVFSGQYGADRNFNGTRTDLDTGNSDPARHNDIIKIYGKLDRGPVPKSVRMRATLIGRFNYYDPRLPMVIR
jgi:hypothetical protein